MTDQPERRCQHSFPDPYPQPMSHIGDCRTCGISYQDAKRQHQTDDDAVCGLPHYDYPESTCTQPTGHHRHARTPHGGPLIINGRECGAVAWDEPEQPA